MEAVRAYLFQSTPPSREATQVPRVYNIYIKISIHASLAGGDIADSLPSNSSLHFNPRLPRGRRRASRFTSAVRCAFQSTPPSREATRFSRQGSRARRHFNPRLPRGRRPAAEQQRHPNMDNFNPRLPRGRRHQHHHQPRSTDDFNPRLPRGRRRPNLGRSNQRLPISIHASLAGGDYLEGNLWGLYNDFNPRLPRGRRLMYGLKVNPLTEFQSTPPSREATARYSLVLPLEHNIWEFLRICREGCCFSLTFVAEKRRISTCFGANRPGKWAQLPLRTIGDSAHDLLLGR